jgi:hypothetical protein
MSEMEELMITYRLRVGAIHGYRRDRVVICISHRCVGLRHRVRREGRRHRQSSAHRAQVWSDAEHVGGAVSEKLATRSIT